MKITEVLTKVPAFFKAKKQLENGVQVEVPAALVPEKVLGIISLVVTSFFAAIVALGIMTIEESIHSAAQIGGGAIAIYVLVMRLDAAYKGRAATAATVEAVKATQEIEGVQEQVREILPDIEIDGQAPAGGKTQTAVRSMKELIKSGSDAGIKYIERKTDEAPAKRRKRKALPIGHQNGKRA